jgi:ABC-2 type transport system permease protein
VDKLWIQRRGRHLKNQSKYLQRVFNDHFVLVLLIMFGAALYAYSQFVKGLHGSSVWLIVAVSAGSALSLAIGRIVTLTVPADAVFLLPRLGDMRQYLRGAFRYSLALPLTVQVLVTLIIWPVMRGGGAVPTYWVIVQMLAQLSFKLSDMHLQELGLFWSGLKTIRARGGLMVLAFVLTLIGLYTSPVIALIGALACGLAISMQSGRILAGTNVNLERMIRAEAARQARIYRFYNLFTDVPGLGGGTSRRHYLDGMLMRIKRTQHNTWLYLYARGLVRSDEYFGLTIRLGLVGAVLILISNQWWLALLLGVVLIYLLAIQLAPLSKRYDEIVFTHLFPLDRTRRVFAWRQVAILATLFAAILMTVAAIVRFQFIGIGIALGYVLAAVVIPGLFVVARVRKNM